MKNWKKKNLKSYKTSYIHKNFSGATSLHILLLLSLILKLTLLWGAWVAQSVKRPTSAQVMILQSVGSGQASGSVLTSRSLEPALDSVSPSLSPPSLLTLCVSLSLNSK